MLCITELWKVPLKKKELKDPDRNHSYSQISIYILNLIACNLILCVVTGVSYCLALKEFAFKMVITGLIDFIAIIICITQIYEWSTMILIMTW